MADERLRNICIHDLYAGADGSLQLAEMAWQEKETEAIMKKMDRRELTSMVVGAIVLFVIMTGILSAINGAFNANVLFDTFFFVCSVTACIGLAACYKNAYIVNLGSGIGGTILWLYKAITMETGISMAVFSRSLRSTPHWRYSSSMEKQPESSCLIC